MTDLPTVGHEDFRFLAPENVTKVMDEAEEALKRLMRSHKSVCIVCDVPSKGNCVIVPKEGLPLHAMDIHLKDTNYPGGALPEGLKAFYSVPGLDDLLLSPRGFRETDDGGRYVICHSCNDILRKHRLPRFAIANGFAVGGLPDNLQDLRLIEVLLCSLVHTRVHLVTVDGIGCKVMKGHAVSLAGDISKTQQLILPRSLVDMQAALRVVVVGATTPRENIDFRHYQEARPAKVRDLLNFFLCNNPLYVDVTVDETLVDNASQVLDGVLTSVNDSADVNDLRRHFDETRGYVNDNIGDEQGRDCAAGTVAATESSNERPQLLMAQSAATGTEFQFRDAETAVHAMANVVEQGNTVHIVRRSNILIRDREPNVMEQGFPEVFPFGYGGPSASRHINVSADAVLRHLLNTGRPQISENPRFLAAVFDVTNR